MSSPDVVWLMDMYERYETGDIAVVLDRLAEDVEWTSALDTPALRTIAGTYHGRQGVLSFFEAVGRDWVITRFKVLKMVVNGDLAALSVAASVRNKQTGKTADIVTQHAIRLHDGKIQRFIEWGNDLAPFEATCQ